MIEVILHGILAGLLIVGYIVLTALGHDGNALLAALGGQGAGAGIQLAGTRATTSAPAP